MQVRILTFVTNFDGAGPGHSAVAVDNTVYTFEDVANGWLQRGSGWKTLDYNTYLQANTHRPVLAQTITQSTSQLITDYVNKSIKNDDDYIGSGVCSTQVSKAVNYSLPKGIDFDPKGFDTPFGVYWCARRLGIVSSEDYVWADRKKLTVLTWAGIVNKLASDYPDALKGLKAKGQLEKY
ncbi:MAG: hypothetical protein AAB336_08765 [Acidobacteriota bacterium]